MDNKKFTKAMCIIFHEANIRMDDEIMNDIVDWFTDDENEIITDKVFKPAYKYNEDGMFYLLRDLMNLDWFWVNEDGTIDVQNANVPNVAKAIKPYVSKDMALRVRSSFEILSVINQ